MPGEAISESMYLTIGYLDVHFAVGKPEMARLTMRRRLIRFRTTLDTCSSQTSADPFACQDAGDIPLNVDGRR
jgi:hypothetical protein